MVMPTSHEGPKQEPLDRTQRRGPGFVHSSPPGETLRAETRKGNRTRGRALEWGRGQLLLPTRGTQGEKSPSYSPGYWEPERTQDHEAGISRQNSPRTSVTKSGWGNSPGTTKRAACLDQKNTAFRKQLHRPVPTVPTVPAVPSTPNPVEFPARTENCISV